jgi:DNA end-binding protein Ku
LPRGRRQKPAASEGQEASIRPFWSGTITFALVSIPVNLFPANRDSHIPLRTLGPDGQPLKREYYSAETGTDVESGETVRGFETERGKYVTVTDEELERLEPEKSRDIDLRLFVKREEIPQLYFRRAYYLTPSAGAEKPYRLLSETMERTGRAGIATFVMRGKEYLVAIFADAGLLTAQTLRFTDEIRSPKDLGLTGKKKPPPRTMLRRFESAIAKQTKKSIDLKEMHDEYAVALLKMIEKKAARQKDVVAAEGSRRKPAHVVDLMEVLKQSLGEKTKSRKAA